MKPGWIRRLIYIALLLLAVWQVLIHGRAAITSKAILDNGATPASESVRQNLTSDALVTLAENHSRKNEFKESRELSLQALSRNPASGKAAAHLLSISSSEERIESTEILADLVDRLWPAHTYAQHRLAHYWSTRRRIDRTLDAWNVLLVRQPALRRDFFPALIELLRSTETRDYFTPYLENPSPWWQSLFNELAAKADLETLRWVYTKRSDATGAPGSKEREIFIKRLIEEGEILEAHGLWKQGLDALHRRHLGPVFDGGFESELDMGGFGWQARQTKSVRIERQVTYGIKGLAALRVKLYKSGPEQFRHLHQVLFLEPGSYKLTMRNRLDSFKNEKGLQWRVECVDDSSEVLGESMPLLGTQPWSELALNFVVPEEGCPVQRLALVSPTDKLHDHLYEGILWFDDVAIRRAEDGA
jgi:hypothetical protein